MSGWIRRIYIFVKHVAGSRKFETNLFWSELICEKLNSVTKFDSHFLHFFSPWKSLIHSTKSGSEKNQVCNRVIPYSLCLSTFLKNQKRWEQWLIPVLNDGAPLRFLSCCNLLLTCAFCNSDEKLQCCCMMLAMFFNDTGIILAITLPLVKVD